MKQSAVSGPWRRHDDTPDVRLRDIIHRSFRLSMRQHHNKAPAPRGIVDSCKDDGMSHGAELRKDGRKLGPVLLLNSSPDNEVCHARG